MREAKARLQEKYQTAQQLGQEVRMTDRILGVAAFEVLKHLKKYSSTAWTGGQDLQMPTISGILNAALENVFDSGPFTESCLGYKAGKRESGHLACSLGGGQSGGGNRPL